MARPPPHSSNNSEVNYIDILTGSAPTKGRKLTAAPSGREDFGYVSLARLHQDQDRELPHLFLPLGFPCNGCRREARRAKQSGDHGDGERRRNGRVSLLPSPNFGRRRNCRHPFKTDLLSDWTTRSAPSLFPEVQLGLIHTAFCWLISVTRENYEFAKLINIQTYKQTNSHCIVGGGGGTRLRLHVLCIQFSLERTT